MRHRPFLLPGLAVLAGAASGQRLQLPLVPILILSLLFVVAARRAGRGRLILFLLAAAMISCYVATAVLLPSLARLGVDAPDLDSCRAGF